MLTAERAREVLAYREEDGALTWLSNGKAAGTLRQDGYIQVSIDRRLYRAHRVAWLMVTGAWPEFEIDHRNMMRSDNSWANLRDVNHATNKQNERLPRGGGSSGLLGVTRFRGRFKAQIKRGGKSLHLGMFDTAELAHCAYVSAKRRLHVGCLI